VLMLIVSSFFLLLNYFQLSILKKINNFSMALQRYAVSLWFCRIMQIAYE
jgi:hypothetical protein